MLTSILFGGDPLLRAVAEDRDRISSTRHREDPAVRKLQLALLDWDPNCLPQFGADGKYGGEMETAVARFKEEVLGVPSAGIIRDVGPKTVLKLDELQTALDRERDIAARIAKIETRIGGSLSGLSSSVESTGVTVHTSGDSAFAAFKAALDRCVDDRALVVIAGWDFFEATPLVPGTTVGGALKAAAERGARVRALFAHFPIVKLPGGGTIRTMEGDNTAATAFVRGLPHGAAIHDSLVLHHRMPGLLGTVAGDVQVGMHHQKAWAVYDGTRLTAFCGGIDFNPDRTTLSGRPLLHDVQVEIDGTQAYFVYDVLRQRWNTHPEVPGGVILPVMLAPSSSGGQQRARVVTTFGDPARFAGLGPSPSGSGTNPPYAFAPAGSKAYRDLVFNLIDKAERFIYLEDQYLVDEGIAIKLAATMPRIKALIMVFADSNAVNKELFQAWRRRKRFLDHLAPHAAKVAACIGNPTIHSKTWIFDDLIAVVGSANVNRRGYKHDSELGLAFGDLVDPGRVKELRTALWAKHLGASAPSSTAPPEAALPLWKAPPSTTRVSTYNPTGGSDGPAVKIGLHEFFTVDSFWDEIIDPDCP